MRAEILRIAICFACDDRYAPHLGVAVTSILRSSAPEETFAFYILDGGISDRNKKRILSLGEAGKAEFAFVAVDNSVFNGLPIPNPNWSAAIYYRLMASRLIPDEKKIIYLDCDLVVCRSLAPLWRFDLGKNAAAGVEDIAARTHIERLHNAGYFLSRYVNSGVLLLNQERWRSEKLPDRFFAFMNENRGILAYPDQDALNLLLRDDICPLGTEWNTQILGRTAKEDPPCPEAVRNAVIFHYLDRKPWLIGCLSPLASVYEEFWALSPWKDDCLQFQRQRNRRERRERRRRLFRIRLLGSEKWIVFFGKTFYHKSDS